MMEATIEKEKEENEKEEIKEGPEADEDILQAMEG